MIKNFKSFNENSSDVKFIKEDDKFIAIAGQFYTDFTDIAIKIQGLKYNIKLYRVDTSNGNSYYRINIIVNDFDILNKKMDLVEEARSLMNEFREYYNDGYKNTNYSDIYKIRFDFDYSTAPRFYGKSQKLLFSKGDDSFDKSESEKYLKSLRAKLTDFKNAYDDINSIWYQEHNHNIDINDLLTDEYPFDKSFDEINIANWVEKSIENINSSLGLRDT